MQRHLGTEIPTALEAPLSLEALTRTITTPAAEDVTKAGTDMEVS